MAEPYEALALRHFDAGWSVFPCKPKTKEPAVRGRSGGYGSQPVDRETVENEIHRFAKANLGIRIPDDVVGLDLDYVTDDNGEILKDGPAAFEELDLPDTVGLCHVPDVGEADGQLAPRARHHLYRVPDGVTPEEIASLRDSMGGIDLLRWMHRLTMGAGSKHKSGETYVWVRRDGTVTTRIPGPQHLTQLTDEQWARIVEFFGRKAAGSNYDVADVDVDAWLAEHGGEVSRAMVAAFRKWSQRAQDAQRHAIAGEVVYLVAQLAEEGESGAERVLRRLAREFVEAVQDRASEDEAAEEFSRLLVSGIGKAVAKTEAGRDEEPTTLPKPTWMVERAERKVAERTYALELNEEFSDTHVALRLKDALPGMVWATGLGWLRWNGRRWKPVDERIVADAVRVFLLQWHSDEVEAGCSSERRARISALLSKPRQARLVSALRDTEPVEAERLDAHPDLLNCMNGVVDLRTGKLMKHDPELWLTKITRAAFRPDAKHPDWERAKDALDPEVMDYLLDRFGQAATGYTPTDDKVEFLTGVGGNGKSTITGPVLKALGTYAALVPATLLLGASDRHPAELMTLRGVRFALAEETPEEGRINVQRLKQIAGVGQLTARAMRQDFVTFDQTHSLFVTTNYPPNVVETDHGTWRRLERVKFEKRFRGGSGTDRTLRQRVDSDPDVWAAVLADIVKHAKSHYENRRIMPDAPVAVIDATEEWRSDMDPLVEFMSDTLVESPGSFVSSEEFLMELNGFLKARSMREWTPRLLATRLSTHEGLPIRLEKRRMRPSAKGFSSRFGLGGSAKDNAIAVYTGARWRS